MSFRGVFSGLPKKSSFWKHEREKARPEVVWGVGRSVNHALHREYVTFGRFGEVCEKQLFFVNYFGFCSLKFVAKFGVLGPLNKKSYFATHFVLAPRRISRSIFPNRLGLCDQIEKEFGGA